MSAQGHLSPVPAVWRSVRISQ